MKTKPVLFICFIVLTLISCSSDISELNNPVNNPTAEKLLKLPAPQPLIKSSIYWSKGHPSEITEFYSYGWKAINLDAEFDLRTGVQENWHAAKNLYSIKYATIWREFASEGIDGSTGLPTKNIDEIKRQIDSVRVHNGNWIYFDDFLTTQVIHPSQNITKATIDEISDYAHSKGLDVAVSEDLVTTYYWGQIENSWSLYEKIDIIMPYGYADNYRGESMYNHLYNFYNYLKNTKGKRVVPILGYNTGLGQNQLGSRSGGTGFIERALQFADQSMVFYWYQPLGDISTISDLTYYLQNYNYIVGTPVPLIP